ncbi:glycosyltransferase [Frondihabitans australicus]|uniref:Glycosyltransferase involved in cell wall biosynthesis n=1 Tax=Frondihabitans australicus TaxID=386892 RepID=A0A495ICQ6_9MICO|nr:glycosyltransferase [Frondihabitans australicus]RKR73248.1 glycosyltransferase involved in cell wall biosynthesis [Frondihabitans australicus]
MSPTALDRVKAGQVGLAAPDHALRVAVAAVVPDAADWSTLSGWRLVEAASLALGEADESLSYLLIACIQHGIPAERDIVEFTRRWRLEGLAKPLQELRRSRRALVGGGVRVESGTVVDITDTGRSRFTTGIQRVARETLTRWADEHDIVPVSWTATGDHLLDSKPAEIARAILDPKLRSRVARVSGDVVIPFGGRLVLPEISVARARTDHLRVIARFARVRSVAIGYDCIPVTTAETSGPGMPGAFSKYLAALAEFSAVVPISSASTIEYSGWKSMLIGAGLAGPEVREIALPSEASEVSDEVIATISSQLSLDGSTVVLAVGSHEPRKNHLNLLLAAELNWRQGREFTLAMVGGNAWGDSEFQKFVKELRRKGRSIKLLSGVDDSVVWSLYRIARFSVFCSVNEGFGLPVVESLASGTPVLTSDFGSMRELGEGFGGVLADPHDARAMAASIGDLLTDDSLILRLKAEAHGLERPTWGDYATALWETVER